MRTARTAVAVATSTVALALLSFSAAQAVQLSDPVTRTQPPAWSAFSGEWAGIARYAATLTVVERQGTQVQRMVFDYSFRKPSSATVHVIQGPNAGATLVWDGGSTLVAHRGSGLLSAFKRTISLHDPLALTIRGSSIDQLSFGAILDHAQQTPGVVSQALGPVIDGVATDAVTLVPTDAASNAGLTLEVVDISETTNLPMRVLGYDGPLLVRSIDFSQIDVTR